MIYNFDDERIFYSGRWAENLGSMATTATGSYFEIKVKSDYVLFKFNTKYMIAPYPHIYISADNENMIECGLDTYLRIVLKGNKEHTVKVLLKSAVEGLNRWFFPLVSKLALESIEADELLMPEKDTRKVIEFVGDSITEGVLTDSDKVSDYLIEPYNRCTQDDVTSTYGYITAQNLGLRSIHMGYGGVGVSKGGSGAVPKASEAYPYCFDGAKISFDHPDYILINHGANDPAVSDDEYVKEYENLINVIYNHHPETKIIVLSCFIGHHTQALSEFVKKYNEENGKDISFISSKGWVPKEPLHPLRDGHKIIADKLTKELKNIIK